MNVTDYLKKVAYEAEMQIGPADEPISKVWLSKFDDSYMTHVGLEDELRYLAELEITDELTHGVGFSPKDGMWYGLSHRAIYGFKIGSTCKRGDCHYIADTPEGLIEDHANWFLDISQESADTHRAECVILPDRSGIRILREPIMIPMAEMETLAEDLENIDNLPVQPLFDSEPEILKCGRGEWTAKTLADAKLMAIDFYKGVS